MTKVTWIQIVATVLQLITSTAGQCGSATPVGVRDELKVIPDGSMTASSSLAGFPAKDGRLAGTGAWCPDSGDADPYLQIALGKSYVICAVEVQGKPGEASLSTNFMLNSSIDGTNFSQVQSGQLFSADAAGGDTAKFHSLSSSITATHIRFKPENTSVCLRVEIYAVPEGVTVTCQEYNMLVEINRTTHTVLDPNNLRLAPDDNSCNTTDSNTSTIFFDITLGTCQTELTISTDGTKSFYRNQIITNSTSNVKFNIICSYVRAPKTASDSGTLTFSMNIYTDAGHTNLVGSNVISLKQSLFFKVDVQTIGSDIELHLTKCLATPTNDINDANGYTFIQDGCHVLSDQFVTEYNCSATPTNSQTFVLSVFRFAGSSAGSQVYFHCNALACLVGKADSLCTMQCDACPSKRKRRATEDSVQDPNEVHLVLGPFTIVDGGKVNNGHKDDESGGAEDPNAIYDDSENFPTTLVIVACISATVAIAMIIGLVVMMRLSKKSRGPAVKDVTADLAQDNLAFDDLDVKTLSIKSSGKAEEIVN